MHLQIFHVHFVIKLSPGSVPWQSQVLLVIAWIGSSVFIDLNQSIERLSTGWRFYKPVFQVSFPSHSFSRNQLQICKHSKDAI
jgi:hypothetical protein